MLLKELNYEFKTDTVYLKKVSSIFYTKEYIICGFEKEDWEEIKKDFGRYKIDYYSYDDGIIVLNIKNNVK